MVSCTRLLKSDTGHRVLGHEGKCRHPHGHEYRYEIEAVADQLDVVGRVVDFSVIKDRIGGWIDEHWDHNVIVYREDTAAVAAYRSIADGKEPFVAPWNPTAENIAEHLLREVCPKLLDDTGVEVVRVRVYETQNCFAEARL